MSDFQAVITQAGLNAAVSADSSGIKITVTHIGAGTAGYTPTRNRTALSQEVVRVPVAGGQKVSDTQWHLTAEFTSHEFAAREVGFYLEDGTLFAPQYIENKLKFSPFIKEAVAHGDKRDQVTMFVIIDLEAVGNWAERQGLSYSNFQDLAE